MLIHTYISFAWGTLMENRLYAFDWKFIGDLKLGRPNLGKTARLEIYRLFQYTLRDVLEAEYGTEQADRLLHKSGFLAGKEYYRQYIGKCASLEAFVAKVQASLIEMGVGILHVEQADMDNLEFTLTVAEDLDCSGLPELGHAVCTYDEGFLSGLFEAFTGKAFTAREIDCWCTGDRTCRFTVRPAQRTEVA